MSYPTEDKTSRFSGWDLVAIVVAMGAALLLELGAKSLDRLSASELAEQVLAVKRTGVKMIKMPKPVYPPLAVENKLEGNLLLKLRVEVNGTVGKVEVLKSTGHPILDNAGIDAAKQGEFLPATEDGKPVASEENLPIIFHGKFTPKP